MAINLVHEIRYEELPTVVVAIRDPLTGKIVDLVAIVDTGAESTLLDESVATAAGIDLNSAESALIGGVGDGLIGAYRVNVELLLLGREDLGLALAVAFAPGVSEGVGNLLGLDVWSNFDVGISHRNRTAYIGRSA